LLCSLWTPGVNNRVPWRVPGNFAFWIFIMVRDSQLCPRNHFSIRKCGKSYSFWKVLEDQRVIIFQGTSELVSSAVTKVLIAGSHGH
jgi:hypothetical protein